MKITKNKKFRYFKYIFFGFIAYLVASSFVSVFGQINDYKDQIANVNRQIEEETKVSKQLQEEKLNMHSDENYKKIARKTLGLVEPGDKVYINSKDNK